MYPTFICFRFMLIRRRLQKSEKKCKWFFIKTKLFVCVVGQRHVTIRTIFCIILCIFFNKLLSKHKHTLYEIEKYFSIALHSFLHYFANDIIHVALQTLTADRPLVPTVIWLWYCRYRIKHYLINQSIINQPINQSIFWWSVKTRSN